MKTILVTLALTACISLVMPQDKSAELSQIQDKLVRTVTEQMPGWMHKEVTPVQGSRDVVIDQWTLDNKALSITIIRFRSEEEAAKSIQQFAADMKAHKEIPAGSDEQYSLAAANTSIVFRKGEFQVYIHTRSTDTGDEKELTRVVSRLTVNSIAGH